MRRNMQMVENRLGQLEAQERAFAQSPSLSIDRNRAITAPTCSVPSPSPSQPRHPNPRTTIIPKRGSETLRAPNPASKGPQETPKELQGIDVAMQKLIMREIVDNSPGIKWEEISKLPERA